MYDSTSSTEGHTCSAHMTILIFSNIRIQVNVHIFLFVCVCVINLFMMWLCAVSLLVYTPAMW